MNQKWLVVLLAVAAYLVVGVLVLRGASLNVDQKNGLVWNQITTGGQKMSTIEQQVLGAYNQQNSVVKAVTSARASFDQAVANKDLEGATNAAGQLAVNVKALAEANPVTDLTPVQIALIDETSEAFNKVGYARDNLIAAQTSYQFDRTLFFPVAGFFPDIQILGSTANPAQPMPTSIFAPTPAGQ